MAKLQKKPIEIEITEHTIQPYQKYTLTRNKSIKKTSDHSIEINHPNLF